MDGGSLFPWVCERAEDIDLVLQCCELEIFNSKVILSYTFRIKRRLFSP